VVIKVQLEIFSLVHRIYGETNHTNFKKNSRRHSPRMREILLHKIQLKKEISIICELL